MAPEVDCVLLCDAASVREGLLHILGGGITRAWRPELPAPLGIQIATLIAVDLEDFGQPHDISIQLFDPDGNDFAGARGGFLPNNPGRMEAGEKGLLPMVFDFRNYPVTKYGAHELKVSVVGSDSVISRKLWILHPDELEIPPVPGLS